VLHDCVGPVRFLRCKLQTIRWWLVDSSAPLLTRTPKHWSEQVSWSYTEINDWALAQRIFCKLRKALCCKNVFILRSSLLHNSCSSSPSIVIYVIITISPITPFHTPASFPRFALKSPKRIVDSLVLTFRRASLVSSTNSGYSVFEFGLIPLSNKGSNPPASTSIRTPFLVGSIHQHNCQLRSCQRYLEFLSRSSRYPWVLQVSSLQPGKLCWLNAGIEEFPPIVQLCSFEPWRLVKEMQTTSREYPLACSTRSCSFLVSKVMFQFPITSLWQDCRLRAASRLPK